jgi:hypothetical protein
MTLLPLLKTVAKIIAGAIASAIIEAGQQTHRARVSRYRNHPHGWRPPDETTPGNQNSQKEPTTGKASEASSSEETPEK